MEQQRRCLLPEIIAALFLALGVRHDDCDQRKYIGFTVQIMEGVIVHGCAEINGIQDLQLVMSFLDENLSHFLHDRTFRVRAYIRCVHLQKVWLDMIAGLTGAGAAQNQYIQIHIPLFRVRDLPQCQALSVSQQDILCEIVIDERRNILLIAPAGGAVLGTVAKLLGVFLAVIDRQPQQSAAAHADQQVKRVQARQWVLHHAPQHHDRIQQPVYDVCASRQPVCLSQLGRKQTDHAIRQQCFESGSIRL